MIIEENDFNKKKGELCKDKMEKIYKSIKSKKYLEKHINFDRTKRIKFLQNYPYDNIPFCDKFVFNNICMFNDLSCVNGYFYMNDKVKMIDFNANFKINDNINISQKCILPESLFMQKFEYKNFIPPLKKEVLNEYLFK